VCFELSFIPSPLKGEGNKDFFIILEGIEEYLSIAAHRSSERGNIFAYTSNGVARNEKD